MLHDILNELVGLKSVLINLARKYGITDRNVRFEFPGIANREKLDLHMWISKYTREIPEPKDYPEELYFIFGIRILEKSDHARIRKYCKKLKNYLIHKYPLIVEYNDYNLRYKILNTYHSQSYILVKLTIPSYSEYANYDFQIQELIRFTEGPLAYKLHNLKYDLRKYLELLKGCEHII